MVSPITSITERVLAALKDDPRTQDAMVEVAFNQGVVTLAGVVKTAEARDAAEEISRQQAGVVTVINELKVV